jgi:hypothetical protein
MTNSKIRPRVRPSTRGLSRKWTRLRTKADRKILSGRVAVGVAADVVAPEIVVRAIAVQVIGVRVIGVRAIADRVRSAARVRRALLRDRMLKPPMTTSWTKTWMKMRI